MNPGFVDPVDGDPLVVDTRVTAIQFFEGDTPAKESLSLEPVVTLREINGRLYYEVAGVLSGIGFGGGFGGSFHCVYGCLDSNQVDQCNSIRHPRENLASVARPRYGVRSRCRSARSCKARGARNIVNMRATSNAARGHS